MVHALTASVTALEVTVFIVCALVLNVLLMALGTCERDVTRLMHAQRDLLGSFVPFVVLGTLWVMLGASPHLGALLFVTFVAARSAHAACDLARRGRLRAATNGASILVLLVLAAEVLRRAMLT